jgi:hypothetical protein
MLTMTPKEILELKGADRAKLWRDLAKDLAQWASECPPGDKDKGLQLSREDQEKLGAILDGMVDEMQRFDAIERALSQTADNHPKLLVETDGSDDPDDQCLVCSMCGEESEEIHTWKRCAEALKAQRDVVAERDTMRGMIVRLRAMANANIAAQPDGFNRQIDCDLTAKHDELRHRAEALRDAAAEFELYMEPETPEPEKTFDNADFYGCMDEEELHATTVEEALALRFDMLHPDWSLILTDVTVTAYRRKRVPDAELKSHAESLVEDFFERIGEEYGGPDGHDFSAEEERRLVERLVPILRQSTREAQLWACEPCGTRTFSAAEVEAMMRESNPEWFEEEKP